MTSLIFETDRLEVYKAVEEDIDYIMELEKANKKSGFILQNTNEEHLDQINSEDYLVLIICEKISHDRVGYFLNKIDCSSNVLELRRFAIGKRGFSYGREALLGLILYTFTRLNINRLWLDVYGHNHKAIKLYESIGMKLDAIFRESYKHNKEYIDQRIYSLLKIDYKKGAVS